jgi:hypothetical protein
MISFRVGVGYGRKDRGKNCDDIRRGRIAARRIAANIAKLPGLLKRD